MSRTRALKRRFVGLVGVAMVLAAGIATSGCKTTERLTIRSSQLEDDRPPPDETNENVDLNYPQPVELDLPSCTEYCDRITAACTAGNAAYRDVDECLATCRSADWAAADRKDTQGNSLSCRLHWAIAAAQDPRSCQNASSISPACDPTLGPGGTAPAVSASASCVLGLYDSTDGPGWPAGRRAHKVILGDRISRAIPTGMTLRLHDIEAGLPSDTQVADCRAIVSVFYDGTMREAANYLRWLSANIEQGRKVVIINDLGAYQDKDTKAWLSHGEVNRVLDKLGVRYDGKWTNRKKDLSVTSWDRNYFRKRPTPEHYFRFVPSKPDITVLMSVARKGLTPAESAVSFISPRGGMVLTRYYENVHGYEYAKLPTFLRAAIGR